MKLFNSSLLTASYKNKSWDNILKIGYKNDLLIEREVNPMWDQLEDAGDMLTHDQQGYEMPFGQKGTESRVASSTDSPEFKAWFRNSKVVDAQGNPLRVYHSTSADFDTFKSGGDAGIFFSTDVDFSNEFYAEKGSQGAKTIPCYLSVQKLFDFRNGHLVEFSAREMWTSEMGDDLWVSVCETYSTYMDTDIYEVKPRLSYFISAWKTGNWELLENFAIINFIRSKGYDGYTLMEKGILNYAVFNPNQIKSAIGNKGQWSRGNNSITASTEESWELRRTASGRIVVAETKSYGTGTPIGGTPNVPATPPTPTAPVPATPPPAQPSTPSTPPATQVQPSTTVKPQPVPVPTGTPTPAAPPTATPPPVGTPAQDPTTGTGLNQQEGNVPPPSAGGKMTPQQVKQITDALNKQTAAVEQHETPSMLPPRYDLRDQMDEGVKAELKEDLGKEPEPIAQAEATDPSTVANPAPTTQPVVPQQVQTQQQPVSATPNQDALMQQVLASAENTNTPEFKAWFRNSKMVDSKGKPQVFYHTTTAQFSTFRPNFKGLIFFSPSYEFTNDFVMERMETEEDEQHSIPVYLRVENPFDFRNSEQVTKVIENYFPTMHLAEKVYCSNLLDLEDENKLTQDDLINLIREGDWSLLERNRFIRYLAKNDYDGLYVKESGVFNIAVFSSNQIKSAIGNNGRWSTEDSSITASKETVQCPNCNSTNVKEEDESPTLFDCRDCGCFFGM